MKQTIVQIILGIMSNIKMNTTQISYNENVLDTPERNFITAINPIKKILKSKKQSLVINR